MTKFLETVKADLEDGFFCDNPNCSDVAEPINQMIQVIEIQAKALSAITAKVPEKVGQNEAADMAIEFKMAARAAKIAVDKVLYPTRESK